MHCLHSPDQKSDVGFEKRPHTENPAPSWFCWLSRRKLDLSNRSIIVESLKQRKTGYLLYLASTMVSSQGFWQTIFANGKKKNSGRRRFALPVPRHSGRFTCATVALSLSELGVCSRFLTWLPWSDLLWLNSGNTFTPPCDTLQCCIQDCNPCT